MAAEGRRARCEGYPGICKVVGGMDPHYATHQETGSTVEEEMRAWTCCRLPMGRDRAVSMGYDPDRGGVCGHRLVRSRGVICQGRAWTCRHPRWKSVGFYPP